MTTLQKMICVVTIRVHLQGIATRQSVEIEIGFSILPSGCQLCNNMQSFRWLSRFASLTAGKSA